MSRAEDPRLMEAKAIPVSDLIDRLGIAGLRPTGSELVGPCPICGGRDRFAVNLRSHAFLCRRCGISGGDQVALAMSVLGLSFLDALTWLCGDRPARIDPDDLRRRQARAAAAERRRAADAEAYRQRAIRDAQSIWQRARPANGIVRAYLARRGITGALLPVLPTALRVLPDHPYVKKQSGALVTMARGPAMIAGILAPSGRLSAVHQTWLDLARPNGKAAIEWQGEAHPAKMVRGSKKGCAIRLATPNGADTLVMGEGIETTLSALVAQPVANAAYWCGIDLGNMSGRMLREKGRRYSGLPDLDDSEAFVPPPWVRRLIFIMDGDSDPAMTRAKLECGLRRAMAAVPGLRGQIVEAGAGGDLNDVLMHGATSERGDGDGQPD